MGFFKPDKAVIPQPAVQPSSATQERDVTGTVGAGSLITTAAQGLKRKAATSKPSLIGGGYAS